MAGAKETPRQKMIGMMYLVLTALLALNVSVEVIDSFNPVNKGVETTITSIEQKLDDYYTTFEQQYQKDKVKTASLWETAQDIRVKTDELVNYIETEVKLQLLLENNGISKEEAFNPKKEDDIVIFEPEKADPNKNRRIYHKINLDNLVGNDKHDAVTSMMITYGKASELREKIDEYRQYIITTVEGQTRRDYDSHIGLKTNETYYDKSGVEISWEYQNFNHVIVPAAFTILNNLIAEVQTAEFDAVAELLKSIGSGDYKFNKLEAKVLPKSTYILRGGEYEAQIYIAGTDTERKYDAKYVRGKNFATANPSSVQTVSSVDGVVTIRIPANQDGEQNYSGIVEMKDPVTGELVPYPFESSFTVAPPSATVAPTKMNVMYRGLENPISVSAPGMASDNIEISVTNGEWRKGEAKGEYFITPGTENITTITASTIVDGKRTTLGSYNFRIKRVPAPTPKIGGKTSGQFGREELIAAGGLMVPLEDFDFEGYKYTIVSYDFNTNIGGDIKRSNNNKGSKFSSDVQDFINASRRGQTLNFVNIRVKGSDGEERLLDSPVVVEIK